jgi:succinyl-diaminopimelate desuccinylase
MPDATAALRADPLPLAQALMRCASITPADAGALGVLEAALTPLGFACRRMPFGDVDNLFATRGAGAPHLLFAGHTDVVPVGDAAAWTADPFAAAVREGVLIGRGAVDMKTAIAAFVAAVEKTTPARGTISLLITGDEEGASINGTVKAIEQLAREGVRFDHCLIGEPSSDKRFADTIKNGRRGSLNGAVTVEGVQGHVAYPNKTVNPVPILMDFLDRLRARKLDDGAPGFDPSNLEITTIDVGNPAHNVIAARASAKFNIRFNSAHSGESLLAWIESERAAIAARHPRARIEIAARATGEAFYCAPGPFTDLLAAACAEVTGRAPQLSTSGGTSDGRFICHYCPVAELGLLNDMAHKVDEAAPVEDIRALAAIYAEAIERYFAVF